MGCRMGRGLGSSCGLNQLVCQSLEVGARGGGRLLVRVAFCLHAKAQETGGSEERDNCVCEKPHFPFDKRVGRFCNTSGGL